MFYLCNFLHIYYGQFLKQTKELMTPKACELAE